MPVPTHGHCHRTGLAQSQSPARYYVGAVLAGPQVVGACGDLHRDVGPRHHEIAGVLSGGNSKVDLNRSTGNAIGHARSDLDARRRALSGGRSRGLRTRWSRSGLCRIRGVTSQSCLLGVRTSSCKQSDDRDQDHQRRTDNDRATTPVHRRRVTPTGGPWRLTPVVRSSKVSALRTHPLEASDRRAKNLGATP